MYLIAERAKRRLHGGVAAGLAPGGLTMPEAPCDDPGHRPHDPPTMQPEYDDASTAETDASDDESDVARTRQAALPGLTLNRPAFTRRRKQREKEKRREALDDPEEQQEPPVTDAIGQTAANAGAGEPPLSVVLEFDDSPQADLTEWGGGVDRDPGETGGGLL